MVSSFFPYSSSLVFRRRGEDVRVLVTAGPVVVRLACRNQECSYLWIRRRASSRM
ncbi:hypothetical protein F2Q68_00008236 [Brassica cretica]|uniref:Uncharacterized protein n=1 Tax=Brassica cretica TaxID=69181 RepID=A0A8S9KTM2_BRACR|nr:hypothetical protein F2Q68_00008236 [Brassica cretica]